MYLFLVDYNYISSEQLQKMIEQILPDADIVNCFSPETLIKIAAKLDPKLIIIDFDLVPDDNISLIETLRESCTDTYILGLIEPDYYEKLYKAIERGLVDDYMVKPVAEAEFAARILITTKRSRAFNASQQPEMPAAEQNNTPTPQETSAYDQFNLLVEKDEASAESDLESSSDEDLIPVQEKGPEPAEQDDFFKPLSEDDYFSKVESDDLKDESSGDSDFAIDELIDKEADEIDLAGGSNPAEDTYTTAADDLLSFSEDEQLLPHEEADGNEMGEKYFDDLFLEKYDEKEDLLEDQKTEKISRPAEDGPLPFPAAVDLQELPEMPNQAERDISLSIKDFMPGNSADDYLKEQGVEEEISYNEDMLERFMDDGEEYIDDDEEEYEPRRRRSSGGSRFLSALINFIFVLLLLMMASLSFFLIHNRISDTPPSLAGYQLFVMQDSGLNADINPGSLAVVRDVDPNVVAVGDIITYSTTPGLQPTATMRVVEINRDEGLQFVTRGDDPDAVQTFPVDAADLVGRVILSIPYYGKMVDYVQTSQGLIMLIFVPGVIIILYQLIKIVKHLSGDREERRARRTYEPLEDDDE
jgi:signal peptidase I